MNKICLLRARLVAIHHGWGIRYAGKPPLRAPRPGDSRLLASIIPRQAQQESPTADAPSRPIRHMGRREQYSDVRCDLQTISFETAAAPLEPASDVNSPGQEASFGRSQSVLEPNEVVPQMPNL